MIPWLRKIALLALLFLAAGPAASSAPALPIPTGQVNDFAHVIDDDATKQLTEFLKNYEYRTGNEILIASIETDIDTDYAQRLFEFWRVGKPGQDNGVLVVINPPDSAFVINGPRFKNALDNRTKSRILAKNLVPAIRKGQIKDALFESASQIITALDNDKPANQPYRLPFLGQALIVLFFLSMIVFPWLAAVLARSQKTAGGTIAGFAAALIMTLFGGYIIGLILFVFLLLFGIAMDRTITREYRRSHETNSSPRWWAGGTWAGANDENNDK